MSAEISTMRLDMGDMQEADIGFGKDLDLGIPQLIPSNMGELSSRNKSVTQCNTL